MKSPVAQRGAATLIVALVLLVALTLATFSTARIGVSEQRNSTNDVRSKAALAVAQAGLDQGLAYLNQNMAMIDDFTGTGGWANTTVTPRWLPCPAGNTSKAPPCGDGVRPFTNAAPLPGSWLYVSPPGANMSQIPNPNSGYTLSVTYLTPDDGTGTPRDDPTVVIVSQANSTDVLAGNAIATLIVRRYSVLARIPGAPIIANGHVDLSGGANIWGNRSAVASASGTYNPTVTIAPASTPPAQDGVIYDPTFWAANADSPLPPPAPPASIITTRATTMTTRDGSTTTTTTLGTPLSIWIKDLSPPNGVAVSGAGTATCRNFSPTTTAASCTGVGGNYTLSGPSPGIIGDDIVAGPVVSRREPGKVYCTPFPDPILPVPPYPSPCTDLENISSDLFEYVFGVTDSNRAVIKNSPETTTITDCSTLHNLISGRYWVTGNNCTINNNVTVGGPRTPFLLVVDNARLTLNGGATFYGLIYSRETTPGSADITLGGGAVLVGSLVSDHGISTIAGSFRAVYDANVLMGLSRTAGGFGKLSGGWIDGTQ